MCRFWVENRFLLRRVTSVILLGALLGGCGSGGPVTIVPIVPTPTGLAFASPVTLGTNGMNPASIAIADFNGDGKLDIAVSNFFSNTISIFLNTGNGTFSTPKLTVVNIPNGLGAIAVGDFNEDGKPDLVVGTISGPQATIVLLNTGNGTFAQQPPIPNTFGFFQAKAIDLNGDGHLDLVQCGNVFLSVSFGKGDGTFSSTVQLALPAPSAGPIEGLIVRDFNGDGKPDIVAIQPTTVEFQFFSAGNLLFFAGNGDGTFQPVTVTPLTLGALDTVVAGDFDGDGKLDVVLGTEFQSALLPGAGNGAFGKPVIIVNPHGTFPGANATFLETADFDLDGKPDVVAIDFQGGTVTLLLNSALGVFPAPTGKSFTFSLSSGLAAVAVGDLNGDGLPDIVVANNQTNQISIILSQK